MYLLSVIVIASFLIIGLEVGKNVAFASDDWPTNGYVCGSEDGMCDRNWNNTECTWSSNGCKTTATEPEVN